MKKVGIVILHFNSPDYLRLTIESLYIAKTGILFEIAVFDNGSNPNERDACRKYVEEQKSVSQQILINFWDSDKNLGFSGGNNVLIRYFLERKDITHICLLNSDVIVTDYWLDYLVDKDRDVIGPVTNAAGNEQTVQIDYTIKVESSAIPVVSEYAYKRHINYKDYMVDSDLVTFFAVIIKREVIEKIGLLDEQFFPGSYEDDDYCVRILQAGYQISIARDCFLHHFGSGSFSKLNMEERKNIGNINRERFEKKWNKKWQDRTWKLLESCKQDMDYLLKKEQQEWARQQIGTSLMEIEKLIADWGEAILYFTSQTDNTSVPIYNYSAKQLITMLIEKIKRRCGRLWRDNRKTAQGFLQLRKNKQTTRICMDRIYQLIQEAKAHGQKPICVLAPMFNKENEKDGYIQRIKAIDVTVLKDMCRIYLYDEGVDCLTMRFDLIDPQHGYIIFNSHLEEHLGEVLRLVKTCGMVYTHSLLRLIEDKTSRKLWQIFDYVEVKHFWDVHGTVPEEYELAGYELGKQLAANIEEIMANKVDVLVVVTEAMGKYLQQKYPSMNASIIVVPIFNEELAKPVKYEKDRMCEAISIVYAGGTQPWQNIALMQDIMSATHSLYQYKMFVPDPEEFMRLWGSRPKSVDMVVEVKPTEELYKEYEKCDFGFVLRDSHPVNYVACPTKIIEYLRFGIIPILKSSDIGDFMDLGMEYVSYQDIMKGIKLSQEERKSMVNNNYRVLDKLMQAYLEGIAKLKEMVMNRGAE